jgi:hypothetical protein
MHIEYIVHSRELQKRISPIGPKRHLSLLSRISATAGRPSFPSEAKK